MALVISSNSAAPIGSTTISNISVSSAPTIVGTYSAVVASANSTIGVWSGEQPSGSPITTCSVTDTSGSFTLTSNDQNFNNGIYTVGFIADSSAANNSSVCATATLFNGQAGNYQNTMLYITGQTTSDGTTTLTVNYSTPNGTTPNTNSDCIDLFNSSTVVVPSSTNVPLVHYYIPTDANAGTVTITPSSPLSFGQTYVLEYNPGKTSTPITAYCIFQFTEQ